RRLNIYIVQLRFPQFAVKTKNYGKKNIYIQSALLNGKKYNKSYIMHDDIVSDENPVFYLQYAHARICSIMRMTVDEKLKPSYENLGLLTTNEEKELIKKLHSFKDELLASAEAFESSRIATYLVDLAAAFHKFYTQCRIIGVEKNLGEARLALCIATKTALKNGMAVLGVAAPEKM
ncbi:MAG TPA: DALR anticodon-binding domain-containing protein, partial [Ignavibacteriales bacterium]|nr:DALR anticodon-binding domain-containing protein [Ignavibacteriales bacterium]